MLMKIRYAVLIVALLLGVEHISAQRGHNRHKLADTVNVVKAYMDSLRLCRQRLDSAAVRAGAGADHSDDASSCR